MNDAAPRESVIFNVYPWRPFLDLRGEVYVAVYRFCGHIKNTEWKS